MRYSSPRPKIYSIVFRSMAEPELRLSRRASGFDALRSVWRHGQSARKARRQAVFRIFTKVWNQQERSGHSMWRQPKSVWAVAFASVVAFMGIGLVDPILKPIAENLSATPPQVLLLFTSFMAVTGVAMLVTGVVSSRIGPKNTLLIGLVIIIAAAGLAGMSDTVLEIVDWRALWGLGNALFIATALVTIVGSARGSVAQAVIFYEAGLGLGIAVGPLVGGVLGSISWRGPFFGGSALMACALAGTTLLLPSTPRAEKATTLVDPFRALAHRGLLGVAITALLYNFGLFALVGYAPFPLDM